MSFNFNRLVYKGSIKEQLIGPTAKTIGAASCFPFYFFEGKRKNKPLLALDVWDSLPDDMPTFYGQVYGENIIKYPASWAEAAIRQGAQAICLELKSIDPNGSDAPPEQAIKTIASLVDKLSVPLFVWGCDNTDKDGRVFAAVAASFPGKKLVLAPVEEANYQLLAPAAILHGHTLAACSPIDVNLAKQLNILLQNQGVDLSQIIIDPTTGGLGYGLEYTYSVMERLCIAALEQNDQVLALPIICNLGKEIWKSKEAKLSQQQALVSNTLPMQGIMMEVAAGVSLLLAGASILIVSHPHSLRLLQDFIDKMYEPSRLENSCKE